MKHISNMNFEPTQAGLLKVHAGFSCSLVAPLIAIARKLCKRELEILKVPQEYQFLARILPIYSCEIQLHTAYLHQQFPDCNQV